MDRRSFLLGDPEESGRDTILCFQGNRLQAAKWRQWKAHIIEQEDRRSTWSPLNVPGSYNLEWDPREEHPVLFPHGWVLHPMAAAASAFMKTLAIEPPTSRVKPTRTTTQARWLRIEEQINIGAITEFVTSLLRTYDEPPDPRNMFDLQTG